MSYDETQTTSMEIMMFPKMNDLPVDPVPCLVPGCPLLGIVETDSVAGVWVVPGAMTLLPKSGRLCTYHATGKLNAFDTRARPGLTVRNLMKGYQRRRSIVRHWAWLRRNCEAFEVLVLGGSTVSLHAHDEGYITGSIFAILPRWTTKELEDAYGPDAAEEELLGMLVQARHEVTNQCRLGSHCLSCGQPFPVEDE